MRKTLVTVAAFMMMVAACTDDGGSPSTTNPFGNGTGSGISAIAANFDPTEISFAASLELFDSCDAVLGHFKSEALARVGPYGLDGGGWYYPTPLLEGDVAVAEQRAFDDAAAPATSGTDGGEGVGFSGSNVQVAGVDEPDLMKTDGDRILVMLNQELHYIDTSGETPRLLGTVWLPGWDHRFFFDGDTAIVFGRGDGYSVGVAETSIAPQYSGPTTLVFEVDLSDPSELSVVRTMRIDGNHLSARAIDGTIRLVVSSYPNDLPFVYPSNPNAEDFALEANKQVIQQSTIGDWLPGYTLIQGTDGETIDTGVLIDCGEVHRPAEFAGFNTLSVLTMSLDDGLDSVVGSGVIANGETIYASTESLYVATNVWVPDQWIGTADAREFEQEYETAIHKFDISGTGPAEYVASGSVDGHLLNQFAMDEHDGYLRVATTDGPPWGFQEDSESFVTVLQVRDDRLEQVGRVGDMGHGERIYSVRFIGDTAYVVTFRQVDPFYVVDLSDPESPAVAGELKISGYSGYLHPVGEDRVLGVGQEATGEGRTTGAKATMFDVSDPSNPREIGTWTIEGGYTDVEWDHLAFLYWPAEELAVLPVQSWQDQFHGAVVLKTDDGVREVGRITHQIGDSEIATDCRVLDDAELSAIDPEFTNEEGMIFQVCADDQRGMVNMECESLPFDEVVAMAGEEGIDLSGIISEGERFEVCWPNYNDQDPAIMRSLVIGDTLWTLSWRAIQANGIGDLGLIQQIVLN